MFLSEKPCFTDEKIISGSFFLHAPNYRSFLMKIFLGLILTAKWKLTVFLSSAACNHTNGIHDKVKSDVYLQLLQ